MKRKKFFSAKNIVYLAVLLALVVVMQTVGGAIKFGVTTSLSFVLFPIVLGAILLGPVAGGFLGFVFGLITLLYGITGEDIFTSILFQDHPVLTSLTCLVKGTAAGILPALIYKPLAKRDALAASIVAAAVAPVANTGIFILGALTMSGTLASNFVAEGSTVLYFLIIGCAGINFILEFAVNLVLSPAAARVVAVVEHNVHTKRKKAEGGEGVN